MQSDDCSPKNNLLSFLRTTIKAAQLILQVSLENIQHIALGSQMTGGVVNYDL